VSRRRTAKKKKWMAIELEDIKKYKKPLKPRRFITAGGCYLRQ